MAETELVTELVNPFDQLHASPFTSEEVNFITIVRSGDVCQLENVFCQLHNLEFDTGQGYTLLMEAVDTGNLEVFKYLLANGANPHAKNKRGCCAIHYAAAQAETEMVQLLIEANCDVNTPNVSGLTPLMYACCTNDSSMAATLVENGANIHARSEEGSTALHIAAEFGVADICIYLTEMGAKRNVKDKHDLTPLDYAARHPNLKAQLEGIELPLPLYKLCLNYTKKMIHMYKNIKQVLPEDCLEKLNLSIDKPS